MNRYFDNITDDEGYVFENVLVCDIKSSDVSKAISELKKYMSCKGNVYESDPYKEPSYKQFVKLFFGEQYDDDYNCNCTYYMIPREFRCSNKNIAERLYNNILQNLDYNNSYRQECCVVSLEGHIITVNYYNW